MAKCKDCLHYEACSTFSKIINAAAGVEKGCEHFKDRSKVAEVVHGRWEPYHEADIGYDEYGVRCSNCGFEVEDHEVKFIMHYCPNCGAKMDGVSDG